VSLGYGANLRSSGTPRLATDARASGAISQQIIERTRAFGLPDLVVTPWGGGASCITVSPSR
jgi:hypothetical protein